MSALGPLWETGPEGQRAQTREIGAALGRAVACMSFQGPGFGAWLVGAASEVVRLLDSHP